MPTRMGYPESRCTGFAFENHMITSFPPAASHGPQGLMVAGQHLVTMDRFHLFLVVIDQLREKNHG